MNYVLDVHTHTIASGHAYNTMREMAKAASEKGLELLGITEHAMAMPGTCHEYYFQNLNGRTGNVWNRALAGKRSEYFRQPGKRGFRRKHS